MVSSINSSLLPAPVFTVSSVSTVPTMSTIVSPPISSILYPDGPPTQNHNPAEEDITPVWRRKCSSSVPGESNDIEDYTIDPKGLQQVLVYLVHHINELSDKYTSLENHVSSFNDALDTTVDLKTQSVKQEMLVEMNNLLENKDSGMESRLTDFAQDLEEMKCACEKYLSSDLLSRIRPIGHDEHDDSGDDDSSTSESIEDRDRDVNDGPVDSRVDDLQNEFSRLKEMYIDLDTRVIACESYSRRDCLIISGIADRISDDALETEVLNILYYLGIHNVTRK